MFEQISTDNIRMVLQYLTIQDTRNLFQACGHQKKTFSRAIKSLSRLSPLSKYRMMWLRLDCSNRIYNWHYNPYQYVQCKIQFRGEYIYSSAKCPCCEKQSSFKFNNIYVFQQLFDENLKPTPHYTSSDIILAGYYYPVPDSILRVGNMIEILNKNANYYYNERWYKTIIISTNNTHITVRYLRFDMVETIHKKSPRIAIDGTHIDSPPNNRFYRDIHLIQSRWSTNENGNGEPVYLYKPNKYDLQLIDETN